MKVVLCLITAATAPCAAQPKPNPSVRFEEAGRALAAGQIDEAISIYEELAAADKTSAPLLVALGVAHYQRGDYPRAADVLASALKIEPTMPSGQAFLGLSEAARGRSQAAIIPLASAFRSTDPAVQGELKRLVGIQLAKAYSRHGRQQEAESVCQMLLKIYPEHTDVLYHAFWLYLTRGRELLRNLVRTAPESDRTHQLLGYLLLDKENFAAAAEQFKLAIKANPNAKAVHYELGNISLAMGNGPELQQTAEREFQEELRLNPGHSATHSRLADLAIAEQRFDKAAELYRKAAKLDATDAAPFVGLCKLALQQQKTAEALEHCLQATRVDPDNRTAHFRLSQIYQLLGKKSESANELALFRKLDGEARAESQYLMGARLGNNLPQ